MDDTPLGKIMSIRSETDRETIKRFSPYEKKIRNDWIKFKNKQALKNISVDEGRRRVIEFQNAVKSAFYKKGVK